MTSEFEESLANHLRKSYDLEGKTIGEDVEIEEIVNKTLRGSTTVARSSKTFLNAMKKFSK